ncbi:enoyl-CoA hydratase [Oceanicoccus sp. KOV_DT_Chl]|uniref:enoyl-CoA hydratase n=1 Tax=Oceanicoccus sp. KOV_DT_Chl TaxID=1904639 RepID=UPI000C7E7653|nr:enoyl-CoA hydratase [Oceanicoccus sp. KOV_DT_Chl]
MNSPIHLEKKSGYAVITLNRPESMNALSRQLREQFVVAFRDCHQDDAIRAIVVTGSGKAFCAGFDLKEMASGEQSNVAEASENEMTAVMDAFDGPIIAAVNGHAITGGFELALACDVIIASTQAKFADTHARVGILPGWGLSQRLPRLIGLSRAKELSLTGNSIDAQQALAWGLVNRVTEPEQLMAQAEQLALDMCSCVPAIVTQYKKLIDDGYSMPLKEALAYEAALGMESAKAASAAMIAMRREQVIARGRDQSE